MSLNNIFAIINLSLIFIIIGFLFYRRKKTGGKVITILNMALIFSALSIIIEFISTLYPDLILIKNISLGLSSTVVFVLIFLFFSQIYKIKINNLVIVLLYIFLLITSVLFGFLNVSMLNYNLFPLS